MTMDSKSHYLTISPKTAVSKIAPTSPSADISCFLVSYWFVSFFLLLFYIQTPQLCCINTELFFLIFFRNKMIKNWGVIGGIAAAIAAGVYVLWGPITERKKRKKGKKQYHNVMIR